MPDTQIPSPIVINLGLNYIHSEGAYHISRMLYTNFFCQLHLSQSYALLDKGAEHLAKGLEINKSLEKLVISVCDLTSKSAKYFARASALKINSTLHTLDIKANKLCDKSANYLAEALEVNKTLKELDIESCGITDNGFACLYKSLEQNTSLECLIISNAEIFSTMPPALPNILSESGVLALTTSLGHNVALKVLQFAMNEQATQNIQTKINHIRNTKGIKNIQVKDKPL